MGHPIPLIYTCPYCGYETDCASSEDGNATTPKIGDISVCLRCGEACKFTVIGLGKFDDAEFIELPPEVLAHIFKIQAAVRLFADKWKGGWCSK